MPKVTAGCLGDVDAKLGDQRLVEPQILSDGRMLLRRRRWASQQRDRVAPPYAHQHERDKDHAHHQRKGNRQTPQQETK